MPNKISDAKIMQMISDRFEFGTGEFQLSLNGNVLGLDTKYFQSGRSSMFLLSTKGSIQYRLTFMERESHRFRTIYFNFTASVRDVRKSFVKDESVRCEFTQHGRQIFTNDYERLNHVSFSRWPIEYVLMSKSLKKFISSPPRSVSRPSDDSSSEEAYEFRSDSRKTRTTTPFSLYKPSSLITEGSFPPTRESSSALTEEEEENF